jgi:hypothetical protein
MKLTSRDAIASSALYRSLICIVLFIATAAQGTWAQTPQLQAPPEVEATMKNMLAATLSKSLQDFVAGGDTTFKATMSQPMLDSFSAQFAPRLTQGYFAAYLARLNQGGYQIYLWKLEFKDGGDDRLVTMVVKDGKVSGFFLR